MFASYKYNAGATPANILSDLVALLTGETNTANLSASCDKANSSIFAAYDAAGWTLHDSAAATNRVVLSAPCVDGSTTKYVGLDTNTANTLKIGGAETWNAVAHTGTNIIGTADTTDCAFFTGLNSSYYDTSIGGYLYIHSTVRGLIIVGKTSGAVGGACRAIEFTRSGTLMALGLGYPCWAVSGLHSNGFIHVVARIKNPVSTGDSINEGIYCGIGILCPTYSGHSLGQTAYRNTSEVPIFDSFSILDCAFIAGDSQSGVWALHSYLGKPLLDIRLCLAGADLDEFTVNSKTYVRIGNIPAITSTNHPFWLPKG